MEQVLKPRRHDRIVQVERRERMGASWQFEAGLNNSEDSSMVTEPWNALIQGLKRFEFVYNGAHDRQGFYVEHYPQL